MPTLTAPDDALLRQFLLGTLAPAEAQAVERWLEANPDASVRLRSLSAHDTVTDAIGAEANTDDGTAVQTALPKPALPLVVGSYRVLRELGRGGMGVVLEAEDSHLKRRVAIKVIAAESAGSGPARDRFLREAQAVARIDHPNVVPVHHVGEHDGQLYLVMPLLKGETLGERLRREKKLTASEVMRIGREVAAGLAAAHAVDLIHRDIKPANIWLDADTGRARILDFGLAKPLDQSADDGLTGAGAVMGTPHYMSPQQANGEPLDPRTDLFSLGAVLHHAATGERPFNGPTQFAVLYAVVNDAPKNLDALSAALPERAVTVIRGLLEKHPDSRPLTAAMVIEWLTDAPVVVATPLPLPAATASPWETIEEPDDYEADTEVIRPRAPARRGKGVAIAAGLLLALGAAFAAYTLVFETKEGTLAVEVSDADADVRFKNGELQVYDAKGNLKYTLKPGERDAKLPAGKYTVRVAGADGVVLDTPEFTIKKDGKVTLRVTAKAPAPPSPDHKAAATVLALGGTVGIDGDRADVTRANELPARPFKLTRVVVPPTASATDADLAPLATCVDLGEVHLRQPRLTDAALAQIKGCKKLKTLWLSGPGFTDAGLAHLGERPNLDGVLLDDTAITAAGLARLAGRANLSYLRLTGPRVTDEWLKPFRTHTALKYLCLSSSGVTDAGLANITSAKLVEVDLGGAAVTDAGLAILKGCDDLRSLALADTALTDAGLAHLNACKQLHFLSLNRTRITDAALARLAGMPALKTLYLNGTAVTDTGLAVLAGMPNLAQLYVEKTRVTAKAVETLAKARPYCRIEWDGGVVEPLPVPDRKTAEWLLARNDVSDLQVSFDGKGPLLRSLLGREKLPDDPFTIRRVWLDGPSVTNDDVKRLAALPGLTELLLNRASNLTDDALAHLKETNVAVLNLNNSPITGAGLAHLKAMKKLESVAFHVTKVTDRDLDVLVDFPTLRGVQLGAEHLTEAGIASLSRVPGLTDIIVNAGEPKQLDDQIEKLVVKCPRLTTFATQRAPLGDAGIKHLCNLKLKFVNLFDAPNVTDAGLAELQKVSTLGRVSLTKTGVTAEGIRKLRAALPKCGVQWDGSMIEPTAADRKAAEWVLSIGGTVVVSAGGQSKSCRTAKDLPNGACVVTEIDLYQNAKFTADGLASLKGLNGLTSLRLQETAVKDADLDHLAGLTALESLNIGETNVTATGVARLKSLAALQQLNLTDTAVNDDVIEHLLAMKSLKNLSLIGTRVTTAGLARLGALPNLTVLGTGPEFGAEAARLHKALQYLSLQHLTGDNPELEWLNLMGELRSLDLYRSNAGDASLRHVNALTKLTYLRLRGTAVTDAGLAQLKSHPALQNLDLSLTKVTDASVAHLKTLSQLTDLDLGGTKVTAAGVAALQQALPSCKIAWDGATEPKK